MQFVIPVYGYICLSSAVTDMTEPAGLHHVRKIAFCLHMKTVNQQRCIVQKWQLLCLMSERLFECPVCNFPASPHCVRAGGQRFRVRNPAAEKSASRAHCSVLRLSEGPQWEDPHYFHGVHAGGESQQLLMSQLEPGLRGTVVFTGRNPEINSIPSVFVFSSIVSNVMM